MAEDSRQERAGQDATPALLVHGGAGIWLPVEHDLALEGVRGAAEVGLKVLERGGGAVDAVIAAVRVLEDAPAFNAGIGSVLTREETIETDASVMEGTGLGFGAVGAVPCGHPAIELARAVYDDGEHTLLAGERAWDLVRERGLTKPPQSELLTDKARRKLRERVEAGAERRAAMTVADPGTVGAVAIDSAGRVAVATSTGGTTYKRVGRIGDTPLAGCGSYADDRGGAASATGHGESITRVTMTRVCVDAMRRGQSADEAARHAVSAVAEIDGQAGIIACDRYGRLGAAHNTELMPHAGGRLGREVSAAMCRRDPVEAGEGP